MELKGTNDMRFAVNRINGVHAVGVDKNNITSLTVKKIIINMVTSSSFVDVSNL
ncbi:hypothetical protein SCAZ3_06525 [Streptococcus canis FSL Z3-227]|uniref:Uncharacterized protein n=1 Tax=Streptococcus canis FSL Z3-227 TaxID=482234 RepID=A0AAV3FUH8_STRCB|nr:hypothetical protein SCAZ3_06525 [Streptococcus canis FSL Z3-227]